MQHSTILEASLGCIPLFTRIWAYPLCRAGGHLLCSGLAHALQPSPTDGFEAFSSAFVHAFLVLLAPPHHALPGKREPPQHPWPAATPTLLTPFSATAPAPCRVRRAWSRPSSPSRGSRVTCGLTNATVLSVLAGFASDATSPASADMQRNTARRGSAVSTMRLMLD